MEQDQLSYLLQHLKIQTKTIKEIDLNRIKKDKLEESMYEDYLVYSHIISEDDFNIIKRNDKGNIEFIVMEREGVLHINFLYINEVSDWLLSIFDFMGKRLTKGSNIRVHGGILKTLIKENVIEILMSYLLTNQYKEVHISGHSLGGGIATIISYILAEEFTDIDFVLTSSGSPKIGNEAFKTSLEELPNIKIYIYTFGNEFTMKLPFYPFQHLDSFYKNHWGDEIKWWKLDVEDHYLSNYYIELKKLNSYP